MSSTAIKVSAEFANLAREAAANSDRSLTGQVEHWAILGRAIETTLPGVLIAALKRAGRNPQAGDDHTLAARTLAALREFETIPKDQFRVTLGLDGKVRYEGDPENPNGVVRINPDGTRVRGKLIGRSFQPAD